MTMQTVTLEEAQSRLPEIITNLRADVVVLITSANQPVARLMAEPAEKPHPVPGRCSGMLRILAEDDEHLRDWAEYMP